MNRLKILFLSFIFYGCVGSHHVMVSGKLQNVQVLTVPVSRSINLAVKAISGKDKPHETPFDYAAPRHIAHKSIRPNAYMSHYEANHISRVKSDTGKVAENIRPVKIKHKNPDFWWQFGMTTWLNLNLIIVFLASASIATFMGPFGPVIIFFLGFFFLMLSFTTLLSYSNKLKSSPWELKRISPGILKVMRIAAIILLALFVLSAFAFQDYALIIFDALLLAISSIILLSQVFLVPKGLDYHKILNKDPGYLTWDRNRKIRLLGAVLSVFSFIVTLAISSFASVPEAMVTIPAFYGSLIAVFVWAIPVGLLLLAYGTWLSIRKSANSEKLKKYPKLKWARRLFWIGFFSLVFFTILLWLSSILYYSPDLFIFYPTPLYYLAIALGIAPIFLWIAALVLFIMAAIEIRRDIKLKKSQGK